MSLALIQECRNSEIEILPHYKQFIKLANLNDQGQGRISKINLPNHLKSTNGETVARTVRKYFNIQSISGERREVVEWIFDGFQEIIAPNYPVPFKIKKLLSGKLCEALYTGAGIDIDHRHFPYSLYDNEEFKNNIDNYQPLSRALNAKKREEKKKKIVSGYKFDNTHIGCAFATVRYHLKDEHTLYTIVNPFNGEYWSNPKKTLKEDRKLYRIYWNKFYVYFQETMSEEEFDSYFNNTIIPKINSLIKDEIYIQDTDTMLQKVMENINNLKVSQ